MPKKGSKNKVNFTATDIRRIIAGFLLIILAAWTGVSVISHVPDDYPGDSRPRFTDLFSPPRPFGNLGGASGAVISEYLNSEFGYLAISISLILLILGFARLISAGHRKVVVAVGEVITGHAIIASLLALPGGSLSMSITGKYGAVLASGLKSLFGNIGAYFVNIFIFLLFIAAATRLDIMNSLSAARQGISRSIIWLSGRKKRREARETTSREDVLADYEQRSRQKPAFTGITGSIIPGDSAETREELEPVEEAEQPITTTSKPKGGASRMEFIPPPIRREDIIKSQNRSGATETPPTLTPPPPAETIDPKKLVRDLPAEEIEPEKPLTIDREPPLPEPIPPDSAQTIVPKKPATPEKPTEQEIEPPKKTRGPYHYEPPPSSLLIEPEVEDVQTTDAALQQQARKLLETLKSFNVEGEIKVICPGPVITRYELEPAVGVKVSRISNLADDIALALKAKDIRIVAPIPGKGAVGIEVPNEIIQTVRLKSILDSEEFKNSKYALPLALGKRVDGTPAIADLTRMPHLLIAGATGSGKSVCINSIITSLLNLSPEDLRLIMIDPKRLELSVYEGIPHLTAPIVVEPKDAALALNWAVEEMDDRYKRLSDAGVRSIADYNAYVKTKGPDEGLEKLPYVIVLIDELADLMVLVSSEIEEPIARLAQMARAVGIHLVIATQRPSVDVITGLIKANFPSRIAFKVRSKVDSRTILDMGGAERLLGLGDMLYLPSGYAEPIRIHGSLITTEETERIVRHLRNFPNPFPEDMLDFEEAEAILAAEGERDELFWEAAKIVVMYQQGSTSFLQRKLRVGYTRAGCIIDQLEQAGIVGPFQGSKAREVLIDNLETLDELKKQLES
ncbi:hypothetical protein DRQ36_03500 [bacterium]|nr:MAG: hypothetical protein DRQ36_03500 [bacterium]